MTYAVAYIASLLLFLAIDIVALTQVLSPMFSAALGDMMLDEPRLADIAQAALLVGCARVSVPE